MMSDGAQNSPSSRNRTSASQSSFTARCFVPETLIDYIHFKVNRELKPASFFIHGVCLLVDISGFTKLSSAFCAQGKDGIDGLQLATNGFMGKLVEIIYAYGGDIIKFAGDAIICIFYSKKQLKELMTRPSVQIGSTEHSMRLDSNSDDLSAKESLAPSIGFQSLHPRDNNNNDDELLMDRSDKLHHITTAENIQPEVVLKAVRCALELRDVETNKLTVHVAMSCGEICFGILGGYEHRWECLISGSCLQELSDCLDDAPSRHAALTRQCYHVLAGATGGNNGSNSNIRDNNSNSHQNEEENNNNNSTSSPTNSNPTNNNHKRNSRSRSGEDKNNDNYDYLSQVQLQPLSSGNYMIIGAECTDGFGIDYLAETPRNTPLPVQIAQFVPVPIASGLESTTGLSYLAEIREVTTMFMKWESYDATGRHRDLMRLQGCFHQVQKILHSTGAFLRQFLVDDKGCVLIACWGMPSLSYLDNPHRALSAAAQIRTKLKKLSMSCSFGITTGDVYCGTVGSAVRMEYAAIGSVVNMSARLMGKAHGGILIDHETYTRLPDNTLASLDKLEPIRVKGREEPLQVYKYSAEGSLLIGDDVVEDHEVREVCKVTFLKLLDRMKAPGRFSAYNRRQSIAKVKEWLSDSVKRGGDLLTMQSLSNKEGSSARGMLRSSFRGSMRMSFFGNSSTRSSGGLENPALAQAQLQASLAADGSSVRQQDVTSPQSVIHRQPTRRGNGVAISSRAGAYQHDDARHRSGLGHEIPYVLMEGRRGSGKSSIINWLKKQATDRSIPVHRARLSRDDIVVDYSVWMKVFKQLMPKDMFRSRSNQSKYLTPLLSTVYADDADTVEHVVMPSLRRALGITCEVDIEAKHDEDGFGGDQAKPSGARAKVTARVITDTLLKIFAYLLNEKAVLVIIENIPYADEESLNVLLGLTHLHTLSAIVLTGLGPDSLSSKRAPMSPAGAGGGLGGGIQRIDSFDSDITGNEELGRNEWYARFRGSVLFYDHATLITLDDFTPQEIDKMLCDALNLIQAPVEISQLVQDLSGGSFFWVKEIMHFLQEHGRDEFLSAIGLVEGADGPRASGSNAGNNLTSPRLSNGHGGSFHSFRILTQAVNFTRRSLVRRMVSPDNSVSVTKKATTKFKLELLVVCRFEKLTVEVQHVLRTASIIGVQFHSSLLYGVLPTHLQSDLQIYLDALLRQKWIYHDMDDDLGFLFTHPYAHKIIYDLTPSSDRSGIHQIIADYIEHMHYDDPNHFPVLCRHNAHCNPDKAFQYTYKAISHLLDKGSAYEIGQCVDLLHDALPLLASVVDADILRIMVYNVRKRLDSLGQEETSSAKLSNAAQAIRGGLFGVVTALSNRWKSSPAASPITPLSMIDEGFSMKSSRSGKAPRVHVSELRVDTATVGAFTDLAAPINSGSGSPGNFKTAVKRVMETTNISSPQSTAAVGAFSGNNNTGNLNGGSSKKEARSFASSERAKTYFKERLRAVDVAIENKVSEFTLADKHGERKDWQQTLYMKTPKKDIQMIASPVKFFTRAGSATKQFFAPFLRRSASLMSLVSGDQQTVSNALPAGATPGSAQSLGRGGHAGDLSVQADGGGDQSAVTGMGYSMSKMEV